jgi:hypothetical protein
MTYGIGKVRHVCLRHAKPFVGKYVNLHLVGDTVVVNVFVESIEDKEFFKVKLAGHKACFVALSNVISVQPVSPLVQLQQEAS